MLRSYWSRIASRHADPTRSAGPDVQVRLLYRGEVPRPAQLQMECARAGGVRSGMPTWDAGWLNQETGAASLRIRLRPAAAQPYSSSSISEIIERGLGRPAVSAAAPSRTLDAPEFDLGERQVGCAGSADQCRRRSMPSAAADFDPLLHMAIALGNHDVETHGAPPSRSHRSPSADLDAELARRTGRLRTASRPSGLVAWLLQIIGGLDPFQGSAHRRESLTRRRSEEHLRQRPVSPMSSGAWLMSLAHVGVGKHHAIEGVGESALQSADWPAAGSRCGHTERTRAERCHSPAPRFYLSG